MINVVLINKSIFLRCVISQPSTFSYKQHFQTFIVNYDSEFSFYRYFYLYLPFLKLQKTLPYSVLCKFFKGKRQYIIFTIMVKEFRWLSLRIYPAKHFFFAQKGSFTYRQHRMNHTGPLFSHFKLLSCPKKPPTLIRREPATTDAVRDGKDLPSPFLLK